MLQSGGPKVLQSGGPKCKCVFNKLMIVRELKVATQLCLQKEYRRGIRPCVEGQC